MAGKVQNDVEDESFAFDALGFAQSIYLAIDSYRSQMSANYNELITGPSPSSGGVGETKLNAFYRMIGLPAIGSPKVIEKSAEITDFNKKISQDGTINYFSTINDSDASTFTKVLNRDTTLHTPPDPARFAVFMKEPASLSAGVRDTSENRIRRPSLFPLVVDASVPVYPLSRRIAPSFQHTINGEDYIISGSKVRLSRPLIDNIIYMRTKIINNEDGIAELRKQLESLAGDVGQDFSNNDVSSAIQEVVIKKSLQDAGFTFIDLTIRTKLLQILKSLANKFKAATSEVQELAQQITFVFTPVSNPQMRSSQNLSISSDSKAGSLDIEIANLKAEIANQNAIAFLLPTEQVKRREEFRRLEHSITTSNITQDVLISQLTSLITYEASNLNNRLAEKMHERDEKLSRAEELKQQLMYYTGEFSGLSIFDIICVIYGLFSIEIEHLIGLLNADAQKRITEDEFFRPTNSAESSVSLIDIFGFQPAPVDESLQALEEKIKEAFSIAEGFANTQAVTQ